MTRARRLLVLCLATLHLLVGIAGARGVVVCLCPDGGVVLEAIDADACACCAGDSSCSEDPLESCGAHDDCACSEIELCAPSSTKPAVRDLGPDLAPALVVVPAWLASSAASHRAVERPRIDADPPDPLRELRTIVLRL